MFRIFSVLKCLIFVVVSSHAQVFERAIQWPIESDYTKQTQPVMDKPLIETHLWFEENVHYPDISLMVPHYYEVIPISNSFRDLSQAMVSITNARYEALNENQEQILQQTSTSDIDDLKKEYGIYRSREQSYLQVSIPAVRVNPTTGRKEKLISFGIRITERQGVKYSSVAHRSASESVLAQGEWRRIQVKKTGIHRISYSELQSMGLSNLENVSIWGHGGRQLSFWNNEPSPDDLIEIPVWKEKGSDGAFGQGDYILFYAQGPVTWEVEEESFFLHKIHGYSKEISYFITSSKPNPKRIPTHEQPAVEHTLVSASYDALVFFEQNDTNLIKSGRHWFGDLFDVTTSRTYNTGLNQPVDDGIAAIKVQAAARSSVTSSFTVKANGGSLGNFVIPAAETGSQYGHFARIGQGIFTHSYSQGGLSIELTYNKPTPAARAWLDYITVNARQRLRFGDNQLDFRDTESVGSGSVTLFTIENANANMLIWDVSDFFNPMNLSYSIQAGVAQLKSNTSTLKNFIAFTPSQAFSVEYIGEVANQNIHGEVQPEMVIVTHPMFLSQSNEIAQIHNEESGLRSLVVTIQQVYNEFSSGTPDVTAIRNMMRMFYDRATSEGDMPRYLLLFGDGSYDNISDRRSNTNLIPTYQSENSLLVRTSYVSDDYFGLLDDNEGESTGFLDIGIGRIPANTVEEANIAVQKIRNYISTSSYGSWHNQLSFIGDDGDNNLHMRDADRLATFVEENYPRYNIERIFLDAYPMETTSQGARYPAATKAINSRANQGALIMNYVGHANAIWLSHEKVLMISDIQSWRNMDRLSLFVTATCEFSRFDDFSRKSAGEHVLFSPRGGSVALLSTSRVVYANPNYTLNRNFFQYVFQERSDYQGASDKYYRLGDVLRLAKIASGTGTNKRNFLLLGDPALKLHYPRVKLDITEINGNAVSSELDTLRALSKVTVSGAVTGSRFTNDFFGEAEIILYDKAIDITTLSNKGGTPFKYTTRENTIYKGRISIAEGNFTATFIIPKDILYSYGTGRFSLFAHNGEITGSGYFEDFIIGGISDNIGNDTEGPEIKIFMNDEKFVSGGITDSSPKLMVHLADSSGINTSGTGIGHDLTATIIGDTEERIVLNDYYIADIDSYQSGKVEYQLTNLAPGDYTVRVKAWDVYNNSAESEIDFSVRSESELKLKHVLNYPNPFTENTAFYFEHNQPFEDFDVSIQVFSPSGKLVKTIEHYFPGSGSYRVGPVYWDGLDDFGDRIGRGVYFYRLRVRLANGKSAQAYQKLVILK